MKKYSLFSLSSSGFSLVELLVAATIIGILAVFATMAYRGSVAETRWAQAKAHTQQLAVAVERAKEDYRGYGLKFSPSAMTNTAGTSCDFYSNSNLRAGCLITKGYIEAGPWTNDFVSFYICDSSSSDGCTDTTYTACVKFKSGAKVPDKFKSYRYCYSSDAGGRETL